MRGRVEAGVARWEDVTRRRKPPSVPASGSFGKMQPESGIAPAPASGVQMRATFRGEKSDHPGQAADGTTVRSRETILPLATAIVTVQAAPSVSGPSTFQAVQYGEFAQTGSHGGVAETLVSRSAWASLWSKMCRLGGRLPPPQWPLGSELQPVARTTANRLSVTAAANRYTSAG